MHAAVAEQPHQMEMAAAGALHRFDQQRVREELARRDHQVDARDVHVDDAAGADVQMADFAVAHLAFGQSDVRTGGVDQRVRIFAQQPIVDGLARGGNRIALDGGGEAPAVEDGQYERTAFAITA